MREFMNTENGIVRKIFNTIEWSQFKIEIAIWNKNGSMGQQGIFFFFLYISMLFESLKRESISWVWKGKKLKTKPGPNRVYFCI